MKVNLNFEFDREDLEQMCLERCRTLDTPTQGKLEARFSETYGSPKVIVEFEPCEPEPMLREPSTPAFPQTHGSGVSAPIDVSAVLNTGTVIEPVSVPAPPAPAPAESQVQLVDDIAC